MIKNSMCLVVEDQATTREFLATSLRAAFSDISVETTSDLQETHAWLDKRAQDKSCSPLQLAIVDIGLPDGSGVDILRRLSRENPKATSVVVTIFDDDSYLFDALAAGAGGYVVKGDDLNVVVELLRRIDDGEPPLSPSIAHRILAHFRAPIPTSSGEIELSRREKETLTLLARGSTVPEAAKVMGLSAQTVAGYVKTIYRKLHVSNRVEAAREAIRLGLV